MSSVVVDMGPLNGFIEAVLSGVQNHTGPIGDCIVQKWPARWRGSMRARFDRLSKSQGGGEWPPLAQSTIMGRRTGKSVGHFKAFGKPTQGRRVLYLKYQIIQNQTAIAKKLKAVRKGKKKGKSAAKHIQRIKALQEKIEKAHQEIGDIKAGKTVSVLRDTGTLMNVLTPTWTSQPGAIQKPIPGGVVVGFGGPSRHPDGTATIADIARFHQTGSQRLPQRKIIVPPDARTMAAMVGDMDKAIKKLAEGANG